MVTNMLLINIMVIDIEDKVIIISLIMEHTTIIDNISIEVTIMIKHILLFIFTL